MRYILLILEFPWLVTGREYLRRLQSVPSVTMTLALVGALVLSGCSTLIAPRVPDLFDQAYNNPYSRTQYDIDRKAYENALLEGNVERATYYRDKMLWSVINDVDYWYYAFRSDFLRSRASIITFSDMAKLGMSAAATVLGGSAVLSGAVTALEGSQLSFDKNFLEQKATESIFTTMDALRLERMTQIQKKLLMKPPSYSFEEAYNDALALFNAGTVPSALQRISASAGAQQRNAEREDDNATKERVQATLPKSTTDSRLLGAQLSKVIRDIVLGNDLVAMKKILSERGISFDPNASAADLARKVEKERRDAKQPEEEMQMVNQLKKLNLWKD